MPEGVLSDSDIAFLEKLIAFEHLCRGELPIPVTTIVASVTDERSASCFVAALK